MGPERSLKKLKKKLEKLEKKMEEKADRSRSRHKTRSPERRSRTRSRSRSFLLESAEDSMEDPEKENIIDLSLEEAVTTEDVDSEVMALLGNFPQEKAYGPELLPSITTRWEAIIKKGLDKDERKDLLKKYPAPANFKILDAPKLNPEAQAAAGENVLKRDKAIEAKQHQVSCAISALGLALNNLCKSGVAHKENIALLSDAARLLCDYHHTESLTRKSFIITGLEKSTKDCIKDTNIDEWLFGADFAEKLKASKAIKKSVQELKAKPSHTQNKNLQNNNNLNFRGTTNNYFKPKTHKTNARLPRQYNNPVKTSQYQQAPAQQTNYRSRQQQQNHNRRR